MNQREEEAVVARRSHPLLLSPIARGPTAQTGSLPYFYYVYLNTID
jgi:hypothetical protein